MTKKQKLLRIAAAALDFAAHLQLTAKIRDLEIRVETLEAARTFTIERNKDAIRVEIDNHPPFPNAIWAGKIEGKDTWF